MGHGSVSNEIKGKRDAATMGWNQSLINIDENGASFRSYIDGLTYELTPEKSIDIQRKVTIGCANYIRPSLLPFFVRLVGSGPNCCS
jgi:hypothetical protein